MQEFIGLSAALLTSFGFLPQLIKIYKKKSAKDLSVVALAQFTIGVSLWLAYGFLRNDPIIIVANLITLVILLVCCVFYLKYR
jgi:MtN3 and saliva related transmembrane protein